MDPPINRQWRYTGRGTRIADPQSFEWGTAPVPTPEDGQALVRNLWLSLDPTNILVLGPPPESGGLPVGEVMPGFGLSEVIESRLPGFAPGDLMHGPARWEDYSVTDGRGFIDAWKVPPGTPPEHALGAYGITGMAAYFGMMEVGRPRPGETVLVSAAAGGVGSIAAQIARIQGARVIGVAGGAAKCEWLLSEARLDGAIDHRTEDLPARLDALCPNGIDVYFDNTGGAILDEALARLRHNARVVICGATSRYAREPRPPGPINYLALCMASARMEGILAKDHAARFPEAAATLRGWIASGELTTKEDVTVGLENAPKALARLFDSANVGKQLVKIADPSTPPGR